jgi:hypothetical protein
VRRAAAQGVLVGRHRLQGERLLPDGQPLGLGGVRRIVGRKAVGIHVFELLEVDRLVGLVLELLIRLVIGLLLNGGESGRGQGLLTARAAVAREARMPCRGRMEGRAGSVIHSLPFFAPY